MNQLTRIAIDGPSGAGKSTIARRLSKELGIDYVDTGAMYRAVAYKLLKEGIRLPGEEPGRPAGTGEPVSGGGAGQPEKRAEAALGKVLAETEIVFSGGKVLLDGEPVEDRIRTQEVTRMASRCSALPAVREKLVALQRKMGETQSVIMDGRDIGTNVMTGAEYKFFLTASAEERAARRFAELREKDPETDYETVLRDILDRDRNDSTRALNPLKKAEDAIEIDTTRKNIDQVIQAIKKEMEEWQQ